MSPLWLVQARDRALLSLTTVPDLRGSVNVAIITVATTAIAGFVAASSGFVDPVADFDPPWRRGENRDDSRRPFLHWSIKPMSAFLFPSLAEEILWRGILIAPHPSTSASLFSSHLLIRSALVLGAHVSLHPIAGYTCWPRGRQVFCDWRFLTSATIILGGATLSYLVSGGSVWAAALTHGLAVALWRDFFGGEALLTRSESSENDEEKEKSR